MKVYLDTSSLFKSYHQEAGSTEMESIFSDYTITNIFLSEVATIEFAATLWKKVRKQDITEMQAKTVVNAFEEDFSQYTFVPIDAAIVAQARNLLSKYGKQGLRTLDSIQLSTAVALKGQADLFLSSDKLLCTFMESESLITEKPI